MTASKACDFSRKLRFHQASPISPVPIDSWPGTRSDNLHWIARREFSLDDVPRRASLRIAADRHYDALINGEHVVRQRNHFHAGNHIFGQCWDLERVDEILKTGINLIEILVRSDIHGTKNHVPGHPFVMMELLDSDDDVLTFTDDSWRMDVIDNWRTMIALATSIVHERVALQPVESRGPMGIPDTLTSVPAVRLDPGANLSPIYEWTDAPVETETIVPRGVCSHGGCVLAANALVFNLTDVFTDGSPPVLRATITVADSIVVPLAVSAMCECEVWLDGRRVGTRNSLPSRALMRQYNVASPLCELQLKRGDNDLEFRFGRGHERFLKSPEKYQGSTGFCFKVVLHGLDNPTWSAGARSVTPIETVEELWDQFSAKGARDADATFEIDAPSSSFSVSNLNGERRFSVMFEFPQTARAYLSFRVEAETAGRIYLAYGVTREGVAVDCGRNGRKAVDVIDVPAGESFYQAEENRVFVYLDMTFEGFVGDVKIRDLRAEEPRFLDEEGSSFESSDELMSRVWSLSRRTAQLCCDEIYMDNPERERGQWIDNVHHLAAAGYYAFGESRKAAKVLEETRLLQRPDGQLPGHLGNWGRRVPLQGHMALYVLATWRHFWHTGDQAFAKRQFPSLREILDFWADFRNSDGLLENLDTLFIDWGVHIYSYWSESPNPPPVGVNTAMNAYYLRCLRVVAELAEAIGYDREASKLNGEAKTLADAMGARLFDAEKGLFVDGVHHPLAERNVSQAANALAVMAGAAPVGLEQRVLREAFVECQPWRDIIPVSAHFTTQAGEALFHNGLSDVAYDWLRSGYGPMIDDPAGTLWETWEPYVSHCQGTASGVVYLLSRYHAGLYPAAPGFAKIGIAPNHCGRHWLKASLKTPFGVVKIQWEHQNDRYQCQLSLPDALRDREIVADQSVMLSVT